jgi:hypothetical protein
VPGSLEGSVEGSVGSSTPGGLWLPQLGSLGSQEAGVVGTPMHAHPWHDCPLAQSMSAVQPASVGIPQPPPWQVWSLGQSLSLSQTLLAVAQNASTQLPPGSQSELCTQLIAVEAA